MTILSSGTKMCLVTGEVGKGISFILRLVHPTQQLEESPINNPSSFKHLRSWKTDIFIRVTVPSTEKTLNALKRLNPAIE